MHKENEEMAVFKSYLRTLMRELIRLKKALQDKEYEEAEKILNDLITDTQSGIED